MLSKEQKRDYQKAYMARKRSNSGSNKEDGSNTPTTSEGLTGSNAGLTDMDPHMRRSWDNVLAMYQADPEKVRRIVVPVCDLKDTVGGETRNAGDCTRWGCFGPAYSDVARILGC